MDVRNRTEEKRNIRILRRKWPGVFLNSPRGDTEVGQSIGHWVAGSLGRWVAGCGCLY